MQNVLKLKSRYLLYSLMHNSILKLKSKVDSFNLVVPIVCILQYKGIYGLAISKIHGIQTEISKIKSIHQNLFLLIKDL